MGALRILVADDSPLVLRMIEKVLESGGFEVVTARDGLEAVEKAIAEDVALVILDVMMPRMNGYQACRLLKSEPGTASLPVVILTSKDQAGDRFWGLEAGADHYITKDSDPQGILNLVRTVVSEARTTKPGVRKESIDILSRVNELLDRKLFETTLLAELGAVAGSLADFDETFTAVMRVLTKVVDFSVGALAFLDEGDLDVYLHFNRPVSPGVLEETKARLLECVVRERGPLDVAQARIRSIPANAPSGPEETSLGGFAAVPIRTSERPTALLAFSGKAVARVGEAEGLLKTAAQQAKIVMENSRLFERVQSLSQRDSLTGLLNHRHTLEQIATECGRAGRYDGGVSLLMIDIDHFKEVNDQLGHPAGDMILREMAQLLKDSLRGVDQLGRYGGEEFACLLPQTRYEEALQTAERIRAAVAAHLFRTGNRQSRISVSLGVASFPSATIDSPDALLREADRALYRAKQAGRNRVA